MKKSSLLETGALPVEDLAMLALREGQRSRPIYQVHQWFARRPDSAFRALLTAATVPAKGDFWTAYYEGTDWRGRTVLDPFVGGGTSVVEAQRLYDREPKPGSFLEAGATGLSIFLKNGSHLFCCKPWPRIRHRHDYHLISLPCRTDGDSSQLWSELERTELRWGLSVSSIVHSRELC